MGSRTSKVGIVAALGVVFSFALATVALAVAIVGTPGPDRVVGTPESDSISTLGGPDRVRALAGDDQVDGGGGMDLLFGNAGNDTVNGGDGPDFLIGNDGNDVLTGNAGRDNVFGGKGDDAIEGGNGATPVAARHGWRAKHLRRWHGRHWRHGWAFYRGFGDRLHGGAGNDTVNGDRGRDRISGGIGDDTLNGDNGRDKLFANIGRDTLTGGDGDDILWALARVDVTAPGDPDGDTLDGGDGDDRFNVRDGEVDRITCSEGRDKVLADQYDVIVDATAENSNGSCEVVKRSSQPDSDAPENQTQSPPEDQRQS